MMELALSLIAAGATGIILGLLFLLALRHSLQRLPTRRHPGLWMAGGMALRVVTITVTLFGIMQVGGWLHTLAALLGFTLARWLAMFRLSVSESLAPIRKTDT